jgi:hypothetical protein
MQKIIISTVLQKITKPRKKKNTWTVLQIKPGNFSKTIVTKPKVSNPYPCSNPRPAAKQPRIKKTRTLQSKKYNEKNPLRIFNHSPP